MNRGMVLLVGTGVLFALVIALASALLIRRRRGRSQPGAPHRTSRRQHRSTLAAAFVAPGALLTTWSFVGFSTDTQYGWVLGWIPGLLAGALIGRPDLVFLDEPSAGLDPRSRRATWQLVGRVRDAGVAVVLTTHDMHEAEALADQVYIVDRGRVTAEGSVGELTVDGSLEDAFLHHTTGDRP